LFAAMMLDDPDANERARASAAAKIVINRSAGVVAKGSVQLHGGIGVSDEHPVAHYLRRLTAIQLLFGDTAEHIATLARLAV
jgi:alkylation response protein AidB-like acyl-CoA dehydrogenase